MKYKWKAPSGSARVNMEANSSNYKRSAPAVLDSLPLKFHFLNIVSGKNWWPLILSRALIIQTGHTNAFEVWLSPFLCVFWLCKASRPCQSRFGRLSGHTKYAPKRRRGSHKNGHCPKCVSLEGVRVRWRSPAGSLAWWCGQKNKNNFPHEWNQKLWPSLLRANDHTVEFDRNEELFWCELPKTFLLTSQLEN